MGGRGASSGRAVRHGKMYDYGEEYRTVLHVGNIKFVEKRGHASSELMETQSGNRIYVHVEGDKLKSVVFFKNKKRYKQIDLDHFHATMKPHTHHGYFHNENDDKTGATLLNGEEQALVDKVTLIWKNRNNS